MKLAIIGDEIDQDLLSVIQTVKQANYTGIEVRSVWNTRPDELTIDQLDSIKNQIKSSELEIIGFDSPVFKTHIPTNELDFLNARTSFQKAVEQARKLDSKFVRVFSFFREGDPNPVVAAKMVKEIIKDIIPNDISVLVETGMKTNTPSMVDMLVFLETLECENIGVLWDPGNTVYAGINPKPFPEDYEIGKEYIKHIHVKDPIGQIKYVNIGEGDLPWKKIVQQLLEDGYDGWFSLETHWRQDRILSQSVRDNPWYDEFSKGGKEASLQSMIEFASYFNE